ncbi:MAG: LysM peptidoglycan-binding domain-containing protein [Bacillota bacterium]|nr:LysM peptidoglycan-binding domain-containing protein [Bacillota bacterium]
MRRIGLGVLWLILFFLVMRGTSYAAEYYTVQPGDSLYLISRAYGLTPETLIKANGLAGTIIWPGQILTIPIPSRYTVRPGDTLYRIALAYGTTAENLISLNSLTSTTIYPGQILLVPDSVPATSPTASRAGISTRDIYLLAQLIHAEANGEPFEGQVAVGAVVLNRLLDPRFPKTIPDIIFEYGDGTYQFEPVLNGQIYLPPGQSALRAAYAALSGWDPTGGALFFYNPAKSKSTFFERFLTFLCRIGNHVFYR